MRHLRRPALDPRFPVQVTMRVLRGIETLSRKRSFRVLRQCFARGKDRFGFRLAHFTVRGHRIHLLCEAPDSESLSRGVKGLSIRIARSLNRTLERKGRVFADRYGARILRTPTDVRNALAFVYGKPHGTSVAPVETRPGVLIEVVVPARTWLLSRAWKQRTTPPMGRGP